MGFHPEPARCADDASRCAPRPTDPTRSTRHQTRTRFERSLPALVLCLALGAGSSGAFAGAPRHDAIPAALPVAPVEVSPETGEAAHARPAASLDAALREAGAPALQAVAENAPGAALDRADSLRFGERLVPRPLAQTIVRASETTGVDPAFMMALADKESGFDTDVRAATSSARGLYQFLSGTWLEMIRDYGARHGLREEAEAVRRGRADPAVRRRILALRDDPYVAGLMAGEMVRRDRARVEGRIGRALRLSELYLAHFLGSADAGRLLALKEEAPERNARQAFARAARANRAMFRDGARDLTVAELHERLDAMIDRRLSAFQPVADVLLLDPRQDARRDGVDPGRPEAGPRREARLWPAADAVIR